MGRPLPGVELDVVDGELVLRPGHRPDVLPPLPRRRAARRPVAHRRPRDARRGRLPALRGPHRRRDHLRRLPDRAVRGRVRARRARGGGRGRGRRRARRRARLGRPRRRRAARRLRAVATRWRGSCRTTSRGRPRRTSTRASWTSRRTCPRPARARSAAQRAARACVVDSVNVSVLLYVPVRSASLALIALAELERHRVVGDRAAVRQQVQRRGRGTDVVVRRAGVGGVAGPGLQRLRQRRTSR